MDTNKLDLEVLDNENDDKQSRSEYLKEWRRKKKEESFGGLLKRFSDSVRNNKVLPLIPAILVCISITLYLISLSSMYLVGSDIVVYGIPTLVEVALLVLVSMNTRSLLENFIRWILIIGMTVYSVAPIVMAPLKAENSAIEAKQEKVDTLEAIREQIDTHTSIAKSLNDMGKVKAALTEMKKVASLQSKLTSMIGSANTDETKRNSSDTLKNAIDNLKNTEDTNKNISDIRTIENDNHFKQETAKLPAWVLILQRLLFMLLNLFLMHHIARSIKRTSSNLI